MSESTRTSQADLCYVKRCSCVVFSLQADRKTSGETRLQTHPWKPLAPHTHTHPPPDMHSVSVLEDGNPTLFGDRQGGGEHAILSILFFLLEKKKQGHFLTQKESACQISVDSDQRELNRNKVGIQMPQPSTDPSIFPNGPATRPVWHQIKIRGRWGSYGFLVTGHVWIFLGEGMGDNICKLYAKCYTKGPGICQISRGSWGWQSRSPQLLWRQFECFCKGI